MLALIAAASMAAAASASPVRTAVDAEYAFARDAQRMGQWTAFRKWAAPTAVMFTPQTVWAQQFLKDKKNPPESVRWRPALSIVSCDGRTAVNTGPWTRNRGKMHGYFTTVWSNDKGQWRWVYDGGDRLEKPMVAGKQPRVLRAACRGKPVRAPVLKPPSAKPKPSGAAPDDYGIGYSADRTLAWDWKVEARGERRFRTFLWNGRYYEQILHQNVKA